MLHSGIKTVPLDKFVFAAGKNFSLMSYRAKSIVCTISIKCDHVLFELDIFALFESGFVIVNY